MTVNFFTALWSPPNFDQTGCNNVTQMVNAFKLNKDLSFMTLQIRTLLAGHWPPRDPIRAVHRLQG